MNPILFDFPSLGSIQSALDQPVFPGKLVIWLLFMLSIVSWVTILSKALQLWKIRKADRDFGIRLRQSNTTLELFEAGWRDEFSLQFLIYLAGARETAFQLLGSRNPVREMHRKIQEAGKLSDQQGSFLEGAFNAGLRQATMKLRSGVAGLRFVVAFASLLGIIGCVWTLMSGFDAQQSDQPLGPVVGTALGFLAIALLVVTPAILARLAFSIHLEKRTYELEKFRDDIARLFERKFALIEVAAVASRDADHVDPEPRDEDREPENQVEFPPSEAPDGKKKRYHSVRDRLLRPPGEPRGGDEFSSLTPIARQTRAAESPS